MEPDTTTLDAQSYRQAMDWSLVLLSQGVENMIAWSQDRHRWFLTIQSADHDSAQQAIQLYESENRRWPWRREILHPGLLFDWASLAWLALLLFFAWLDHTQSHFRALGILDVRAVSHGQWWRLFTAIWLHADAAHLAANASIGFVLLGLAMGRYGTGVGLLGAYLAGVGGNLLGWLVTAGPRYSLGASGMVMGALGLLAMQSWPVWLHFRHAAKSFIGSVAAGIMLFVLLGLTPGTDIIAHAGGFGAGLLLGAVFNLLPGLARRPLLNFVAGLILASLVVYPWWRALNH